jgi:hypothetical protein
VESTLLRTPADGEDGPNGVYRCGTGGGFPTETFNASNHWVDVIFALPGETKPAIKSQKHTIGVDDEAGNESRKAGTSRWSRMM